MMIKDNKLFLHRHDPSSSSSSPSSSSPHPLHPPPPPPPPPPATSVELPRRSRGRPRGSKNKPRSKPQPSSSLAPAPNPCPPSSMGTLLLQIDPDNDVVECVTRFCRNKSLSLSILSASGSLSQVTLRHPFSPSSNIVFRGRFEILSISATVITESSGPGDSRPNQPSSSSSDFPSRFAVTLSGPHGQVVGGTVGGPLIAAGPVFIVAASFDKPTYHRLPEDDIDEDDKEEKRQAVLGVGGNLTCNVGGSDAVWGPPPY